MIDKDTAILQALITALDGNVSYNGNDVPVYCEQNPKNNETVYILLSSLTSDDNRTKSSFGSNYNLLIDIVHKAGNACTYDVVNDISGQIQNIIEPDTTTTLPSPDSSLQFCNVLLLSTQTLPLLTAGNNVMRKLLRYSLQVFEV